MGLTLRQIGQWSAATSLGLSALGAGADGARAACAISGTDQTCVNSTFLPNTTGPGITDSDVLTLTNTATGVIGTTSTTNPGVAGAVSDVTNYGIIAGSSGIDSLAANVTNFGTIRGTATGNQDAGIVASFGSVSVANSGTITGATFAIIAETGAVTVTNSGTITQTVGAGSFPNFNAAIFAVTDATVNNTGTISGVGIGIMVATGNAIVTNSGNISGGVAGILAFSGSAAVSNSGTISGGQFGISTSLGGAIVNAGTIRGGEFAISSFSGSMSVTNAGDISSPGGAAISFSGGNDSLTLLPGSFIVGAIDLGTNDTLRINAPNQNLTFNTLAGATITGTVPYVVVGNRIASIDATALAGADRNVLAFLDSVSGLIGGQTPAGTSGLGGAALGFNGPSYVAANAEEAFAEVLGYAKALNDAVVFKNPTQTLSDGTTVWAKGFLGQRVQEADGITLRNVTKFYGGAIGVDRQVQPDLKLGGFVGGGNTQTTIDLNAGGATSDLGFAGIYGRKDFGRVFLDADVIAGGSSNHSTRNINNNLLPGGLETATASFGGWFVSPEAALGMRYDVAPSFTLTPAARMRYLAAGFDGYTESGSTANLTLGSRLLQDVEERADLTLTHTTLSDTGRFQVAGTVGVLGLERAGGTALNAVLLGQALSFATPGPSTVGGVYGSVAVDWKTLSGMTLYAAVDYTAYSDSSSIVAGRAGVRIGF